jgi:outer membrane protein TolC
MIRFIFLVLLSLSFQAQALSLAEALAQIEQRTNVINTRLELDDAELSLARTQADPLALRLELTQAQQRRDKAVADLTQIRFQEMREIANSYVQVLNADLQRELAQTAVNLAEQSLAISKIRFDKGSATNLDVQDAQNNLDDSMNNLRSAQEGLNLAKSSLASLIGLEVDSLEAIPESAFIPLPLLEDVLTAIALSPNALQATQGQTLAQLGLDLLDPSYAPQAQIDSAELQLETATEFVREAYRGLELQARSVHNSAQTAENAIAIRLDALRTSEQRLAIERQRLESGLIAEITYNQTALQTQQATVGLRQSQHSYLVALFDLQQATMYQLPELFKELE